MSYTDTYFESENKWRTLTHRDYLREISSKRFFQPLLSKKVAPWSKSDIPRKSLSAWRGVLRESLQPKDCSGGLGGRDGKSTIANAWSVLSLTLKKRSVYRFFSHALRAAGSHSPINIYWKIFTTGGNKARYYHVEDRFTYRRAASALPALFALADSLDIIAVLQSRALIVFRTSRFNFGLSLGSLICCRSERIVVPIKFVTLQLFSAYVSVMVDVDVSRFPNGRHSSVWISFRTPDIFESSS